MTSKANKICAAALMLSLSVLAVPFYLHAAEVVTLEQAIDIALKKTPSWSLHAVRWTPLAPG